MVDEPDLRMGAATSRRARFEDVYAANYHLIFAYALRRSDGVEDAADVVAETFLTAWRRLDDVPAGEAARLWLYGTARRVLANQRRGRRRAERLVERVGNGAPDEAGSDPDISAGIAAAFGRLGAADQEVLGLVVWEGLTAAEAARVLGRSAGAVRVLLHRARGRFARQLAAEGIEVGEESR